MRRIVLASKHCNTKASPMAATLEQDTPEQLPQRGAILHVSGSTVLMLRF